MDTAAKSKLGARQWVAFALLCAIWGSTWMAISVVVRDVPPFHACALRFLLATVLMGGALAVRRRPLPRDRASWKVMLVLGVTMIATPYALIFWAEQYVASSMTAVIYSLAPLLVALLTPLMSHRKVPRRAVFAMVLGVGGIAVIFETGLRASTRALVGGFTILLAVLVTSWAIHYAKKRAHDLDPLLSTGVQHAVGTVALFGLSVAFERHATYHWTAPSIAALFFLGVIGSALAFAVYYWLLKQMEPYKISSLNLVTPLIAIAEGALLLGEPVPLIMIIASLVVLGAVASVLRAPREKAFSLRDAAG
ncbi:MAG TPA: EamA family transporter [Terriglobales bacterium]|nr:EamA family transporter [Terriglobales bacterium]